MSCKVDKEENRRAGFVNGTAAKHMQSLAFKTGRLWAIIFVAYNTEIYNDRKRTS